MDITLDHTDDDFESDFEVACRGCGKILDVEMEASFFYFTKPESKG